MKYDITLLTESRYAAAQAAPDDWYLQQILTDDHILSEALARRGFTVIRKNWADPDFDWASTRMALFRTTWDYFHRFAEFSEWLDRVSTQTQLINSLELIRWNMDKHYLLDLQERGIPIPPTRIIHQGETITLTALHAETGWTETVLKPTISGGARHTYRLHPGNLREHEAVFQSLIVVEDMLLQPLQNQVIEQGELSLMVMGGQFTHAVLKIAKPGDFRVQDDFGGTVHAYTATSEEIALAERAVAACTPAPLYARVDMIRDNDGNLAVMELELIEPELWFRFHPRQRRCWRRRCMF
jgi:glutathione synthase/RimK-type ligase-like ATP-grasp enzyme